MKIMKLLVAFAICSASALPIAAGEKRFEPRKFVEYSKCKRTQPTASNCQNSESEWALLDGVGNLLKSDLSVNAYLVGYSGRDSLFGSGIVHANYARNLLRRWVADDTRVRAVYGGRRENLTIEIWIVSDFLSVPESTPTVPFEPTSSRTTQKYFEYRHPYVDRATMEMFSEYQHLNQPAFLDGLAVLLERDTNARTYIVAYDGKRDRAGTAYKLAESDRYYLAKESNIHSERVVLVKGGRRENRMVELWIVPEGGVPPKLPPTR